MADLRTNNLGSVTVFANGHAIAELRHTVTHHRTGKAANATRTAAAGVGTAPVNFPKVRGRDVPVGYIEVAFHTNANDGALLAQRWFRHAAGVALAKGTETMIGEHTEALSGDDVKALLRWVFGPTAAVTGLAGGAGRLAAADIERAIRDVTGQVVDIARPERLVVEAIEAARNAATRLDLVQRLSPALATVAGYDVNDAGQNDDVARAALAPLLRAAGAAEPAANAVPAIANLPRSGVALTRADIAMFLAAGLGLRPATLANVTQPINTVTLLTALAPAEIPAKHSCRSLVDAAITAAPGLRPEDVWRPFAVQVTDGRQNLLPTPTQLVTGAQVRFVVDLAGTAFRGTASDVELALTVGATPVATIPCEVRTPTRLVSKVWPVQLPAGVTGTRDVVVTVRARNGARQVALHGVTVQLILGATAGSNGTGGRP